ncbi:MAG: helix-turn-helix transcriptional regulator [Chlorobi bacterium]|nr:helix-turn-helix transcriptional regulator [Chlorobiota bacterium]
MEVSFNIVTVIMILGMVQGFFLSLLLATIKKENQLSGKILAVLIMIVSLLLLLIVFYETKQYELTLFTGLFLFPATLSIGPLLYLYTKSLIEKDFKFSARSFVHFIPYFLALFYLLRYYFIPQKEALEFIHKFFLDEPTAFEMFFRYVDIFLRATYTIAAIKILIDYGSRLKEEYSSIEKFDFRWLRYLLIVSLFTTLFLLTITLLRLGNNVRALMGLIFSVLIYVIGYEFIKHNVSSPVKGKTAQKTKYKRSGLAEETKNEISGRLKEVMKKRRLFLNPDLTLNKLAEILELSPNHLSQVINEMFGKNFFDFVNGYRIEEAKKFLTSHETEDWTILAIAYEVGFQSKSTFNAVFKKVANETPSQYRKANRKG